MNRSATFIVAALFTAATGNAHSFPVYKSVFQANLEAFIAAANTTDGFLPLKGTELSRGEWTSTQELEGFLPTIREKANDPRGVLMVSAVSVSPAAYKNADMLIAKGMPGYTVKDSNKDRAVVLNAATESRRVIFARQEKYAQIIVTLIFTAHQDNAVTLTVEKR